MGACFFTNQIESENPTKAYDALVEDAIRKYGNDSYNGTISTWCGYAKSSLSFNKYSKTNELKARRYIDKTQDNICKRDCLYIDLGVVRYETVKAIKKKVVKEKPVYKKMFVVYWEKISDAYGNNKRAFDKLADAEKFAFKKKLESSALNIYIKYEYFLVKGKNMVETFDVKITPRKTRPQKVGQNTVVKEIHKYIFYGWAAE